MSIRVQDVLPISEASSQLTELAEDAVRGAEQILTKDGVPYVVVIAGAQKLAYFHALEAEHGRLVMADDALEGFQVALAGKVQSEDEFRDSVGRSGPRK